MIHKFKSYINEIYTLKGKTKKKFKNIFSPSKQHHSKRVHEYILELDSTDDMQQAALFHDFIERGGSKDFLRDNLSTMAFKLIKVLTHKSDKSTLQSLKHHFASLNDEELSQAIKLKLADRADNFNSRINNNKLKDKYVNKTSNLLTYLYSVYPYDKAYLNPFITTHFINKSTAIAEKLKLF